MKTIALYLFAGDAFAQVAPALTAAVTPTDWTGLAIIGGFVLLVAGLIVWHLRHPTTADKTSAAVITTSHSLLSSLTNLLHAQHATIDQHAATIATLAAPNGPPSASAAPVGGFVLPQQNAAPSGFVLPSAAPASSAFRPPWKT